jgi:tripartite-type tricarboxylate transporter receptor subunit TctC
MIFPVSTSSESFGAFIREDLDRWRRVVAAAGLAPKQ